jgi:bisphosphoglycerate-independent phosphoglycerate mutase (AlkP superfamily)
MINLRTGDIDKDHTTNPVPFLIIANEFKFSKPMDINFMALSAQVPAGVISDVAPTVLDFFGLPKPAEMTGINLLSVIDEVPNKIAVPRPAQVAGR